MMKGLRAHYVAAREALAMSSSHLTHRVTSRGLKLAPVFVGSSRS